MHSLVRRDKFFDDPIHSYTHYQVTFPDKPRTITSMNPQLKSLIELQAIDNQIGELEHGKAAIPKQIESGKSGVKEKQNQLAEAESSLTQLQKERKDLEIDVIAENDHAAKTKTKLSSVKTNKEYSAILVEVDAVKEKILALEDRELELMEILERKERELLPLKANCKEEEEKFNEYKLKKEAESERTEKELEVIRPRRSQAADNLDVKLLEHYTKVFNAREGVVVVPIHENICQGCLQHILPQQVIDVKSGETIIYCEQCSRILYWEETKEGAVPK